MKDHPMHHYIPGWMIKELKNRQCGECGHLIKKDNIIAIGIRESRSKGSEQGKILYMEHQCPSCEYREMTSCGGNKKGSIDEMCYLLIEEGQRRKSAEKAKRLRKTSRGKPWTSKEVEDFKEFMSKCTNHDQFMKHIRASQYLKKDESKDEEKPSSED